MKSKPQSVQLKRRRFKMRSEKARQDKQGKIILVCLGVIVAFFFIIRLVLNPEKYDSVTGCPTKILRSTVFILDKSSQIAEQTRNEIISRIERIIAEKVQTGEKVSFLEVNDSAYEELKPLKINDTLDYFCKPKSDADNKLTENSELIKARYKKRIKSILSNEFLKDLGGNSKSPIAQVVFDAVLSQNMNAENVSLYLFSDLMENSKDVSLYGCTDGKTAVNDYRASRSGRVERPVFRKIANIQIHVIPEKIPSDTMKCRDHFWNWFFGDMEFSKENNEPSLIWSHLPG